MVGEFERTLSSVGDRNYELNDLLSTAAHLTAASIHQAISSLPERVDEVIASGGGVHNKTIMGSLRALVDKDTRIKPIEHEQGLSEAKEAIAFALLGAATLDGVPSNVPSVTGAKRAVVLGSITPKP
jgi:anhydro-N-acetylmuramic acid kinase